MRDKIGKVNVRLVAIAALVVALGIVFPYLNAFDSFWSAHGIVAKCNVLADSFSISMFILICIYGLFLYRTWHLVNVRQEKGVIVVSVLLAFLWVVGCALAKTLSTRYLLSDIPHGVVFFVTWGLVSFFLYSVIRELFVWLERKGEAYSLNDNASESMTPRKVLAIAAILFLCWLPYIVVFFPGTGSVDMSMQIEQFVSNQYDDHHPVFATLLYGVVYSLGNIFGGTICAVAYITLFQSLMLSLLLAIEICCIARLGAPKPFVVASAVFFGITPLFGSYCQWSVKDSLFGAVFAGYAIAYGMYAVGNIKANNERGGSVRPSLVPVLVFAALMSLLRHNGFYVALLSLPCLCLLCEGIRARLRELAPIVLTLILIPVLSNAMVFCSHAKKGGVEEALSLPFQQIARYVASCPEDIEPWEKEAIDDVLDFEGMADDYLWYISDPIKKGFKSDGALFRFFSAWASVGLRHPQLYFDAAALHTYGYWSIATEPSTYHQEYASYSFSNDRWNVFVDPLVPENIREYGVQIIDLVRNAPFASFFSQMGSYTWLLVLEFGYLLYRGQGRASLILLPSFLLLLTCLASPLNGSVRYMLGIVCVAPFTLWCTIFLGFKHRFCISSTSSDNTQKAELNMLENK